MLKSRMIFRSIGQFLKQFVLKLNDCIAVGDYLFHRMRAKPGLTILCYHRVASNLPKLAPFNSYSVSLPTFVEQINHLLAMGDVNIISGKDLSCWLNGDVPNRGSYVLLTFDDGYKNVIPAATFLHDRKLSAVFFVSTAYLGQSTFSFVSYDRWCRQLLGCDPVWYTPLSLDDCRLLLSLEMEVQGHGHTHRSLGKLNVDEVKEEFKNSKEVIEDQLGKDLYALAFPYGSSNLGDFNSETESSARDAGYVFAVATDVGVNHFNTLKEFSYRLKRIPISDNDRGLFFKAKAAGYFGLIPLLKMVWHRILLFIQRAETVFSGPRLVDTSKRG